MTGIDKKPDSGAAGLVVGRAIEKLARKLEQAGYVEQSPESDRYRLDHVLDRMTATLDRWLPVRRVQEVAG